MSNSKGEAYVSAFYPHLLNASTNCTWANDTLYGNATICTNGTRLRKVVFVYMQPDDYFS